MWEYVKGSEADFEGAPDEATVLIGGSRLDGLYWAECFRLGAKYKDCNLEGRLDDALKDIYNYGEVIAQRRKVDDLQSRTSDANLQQAFDTVQRPAHYNQSGIDAYDKYNRPCKGVTIDVYDVLVAFNVTNPALQHLIKKALAVGQRGHKDKTEDLNDILASAKRAIELEEHNK